MSKKAYKELQKKLKNRFKPTTKDYNINGSVGQWVAQSNIKPKPEHTKIICLIFGSVPYCYQESDRKVILNYLKKHKYKEFKRERLSQ